MKAIDIIEAMCYDSALAEVALVCDFDSELKTAKEWCEDYFDAHLVTSDYGDHITTGKYLAVCQQDFNRIYPFDINNQPDFILERYCPQDYDEDDRRIYLWRIE